MSENRWWRDLPPDAVFAISPVLAVGEDCDGACTCCDADCGDCCCCLGTCPGDTYCGACGRAPTHTVPNPEWALFAEDLEMERT